VTPQWLAARVRGETVAAESCSAWRLFEVAWDGNLSFTQGHVPGARYLDTRAFERAPRWTKVPDPELLQTLLDHGVRHDTTVILYGRNPLAAARVAHLMLYAGVTDVRLLDGGFSAWLSAACPVESGVPAGYPPARDFGARLPGCGQYLVDTQQVKRLLQQQDAVLVSIRSWSEHIGSISGYSTITAKGEIPGALWGRAGDDGDVNSMSDFQRPDGTMKPPHEILAFWQQAGIEPSRHTVFFCGTAWRASLAFFYAWLMNWERISVYDGGWHEWSRDPANPVDHGTRATR
jgi:3-mercaptopyruvate sulfurtransferase SseA